MHQSQDFLFVLEEVHHSFSPLVWLTSFSAAISANFVSLHFFGLQPVLYIGPVKSFAFRVLLDISTAGRFARIIRLDISKHCCPYQKYMEKSKAFLLIIMVLFLLF